jgi:hypothetical protein
MRRFSTPAVAAVSLAIAVAMTFSSPASAAVPGRIVYNSVPRNLPGNVPSEAFQAQKASEFGDAIKFAAGTSDHLRNVKVVMSSWACQSGTWDGGDCASAPGSTFSIPITLTLYQVDAGTPSTAGSVIESVTKAFNIPYRPSADPDNCPDTPERYQAADGKCYNGLANKITFNFSSSNATLPSQVIYGITYNTSDYGYDPEGENKPCNSTPEGCPYDSLNVASAAGVPAKGTDLFLDGVFLYSAAPGAYCDGGVGGTDTFRLDDGCWTG